MVEVLNGEANQFLIVNQLSDACAVQAFGVWERAHVQLCQ